MRGVPGVGDQRRIEPDRQVGEALEGLLNGASFTVVIDWN